MTSAQLAYKMFKTLCHISDCDIEEKVKQKDGTLSGTIGELFAERQLFEIYKYYVAGDYEISIDKSRIYIRNVISDIRSLSNKTDELRAQVADLQQFVELMEDYDQWKPQAKEELIGFVRNLPFIDDSDLNDEIKERLDFTVFAKVKKGLTDGKYVKFYRYAGNELLPEDCSYALRENVIATTNAGRYLNALTVEQRESGMAEVSYLMQIEDIIDYTYFVICVKYGDSVWIATDRIDFENPRCASSSRNPAGRRESTWDNVALPYALIDEIIRRRDDTTEIAKERADETYVFDVRSLAFGDKLYLNIFAQEIIRSIRDCGELNRIGLADEMVQKLLASGESGAFSKSYFSSVNYDECKRVYIDDLVLPTSTDIVPLSMEDAIVKYTRPGALITFEQMESLAQWSESENRRIQKQKILDDYYRENEGDDKSKLEELIKENRLRFLEYLFSGREKTYLFVVDNGPITSFGREEKELCPNIFSTSYNNSLASHLNIFGGERDACFCCDEIHAKKMQSMKLYIYHWAMLTALLGIGRQDLPFLYQNYKSYQFQPYLGNTILDNVNPEFLVSDKLSKRYGNSLEIGLHICKKCCRKLIKQYGIFDEAVIIYSRTVNTVIDVVDKNSFTKEYPNVKFLEHF